MKFTLSWLKEHLDTDASVDEIADTLTLHRARGRRGRSTRPSALETFRVAEVVEAEKHPDADKLQVLRGRHRQGDAFRSCAARPMRAPA